MERVTRTREVEYKITFIPRSRETFIYLGSMWAGRILHAHQDPLHRTPHYAVFLQLPGMWGPTGRLDSLNLAKLSATESLKRWLGRFVETPEPPPEQLIRALAKQDRRAGNSTPSSVPRMRRSRPVQEAAPIKVVRRTRT